LSQTQYRLMHLRLALGAVLMGIRLHSLKG